MMWRAALLGVLGVALSLGCGDDAMESLASYDAGGAGGTGGPGLPDVVVPLDGLPTPDHGTADTPMADVGPLPDAGPDASPDAVAPDDGHLFAPLGKADDLYLIPPTVAGRSALTLGGSRAAWVERAAPGQPTRLAVWDLDGVSPPVEYALPYLHTPRQLALGDGWLFFVDDRYGDADVFALDLTTGEEVAVATLPGAQHQIAAYGDVVAWRDCRFCLEAGGSAEIYRRAMGDDTEERLTTDSDDDRNPALGTLGDGSTGLVFVADDDLLLVWDDDGELGSFQVETSVSAAALTQGRIGWRASPMIINPDSMMPEGIINPDSMMPSDVYLTDAELGVTYMISQHAVLEPDLDGPPEAAAGRVAWLESLSDDLRAVRVLEITSGLVVAGIEGAEIHSVALGDGHVGFIAPRADNDGQDDVWLLGL